MRVLFCLYKYHPYGGLQRDFLAIARICLKRGHHVTVLTTSWEGDIPQGLRVIFVRIKALTNHSKMEAFSQKLMEFSKAKQFDLVVGFNKVEGLDLYYAADTIFARDERIIQPLLNILPRYKTLKALERKVFSPEANTKIILLSERDKKLYMAHYGTQEYRFMVIPPGIARDRMLPRIDRKVLRGKHGVKKGEKVVLMVGSGFKTKGVDRAIRAVAALPNDIKARTHLWIIGKGKQSFYKSLAKIKGIGDRVKFLGPIDDVPSFLHSADLLLHPARREAAGIVLIEAMAAGVPILASEICGYAEQIRSAGAGKLIPVPFSQSTLNRMLNEMLLNADLNSLGRKGKKYVIKNDLFHLHENVANIIENMANEQKSLSGQSYGKMC